MHRQSVTDRQTLTDEQLLSFLGDGFLELTPGSLTEADHRHFHDRAADLYRISGALESPTAHLDTLGDNVRAQIPEIDLLLNDPVIDGALTDLLGEDYLIHPHNFCHRSGSGDQVFHQDGNLPWNERAHQRSHRPEWLILFYYPQIVDRTNGPTEIVSGSQYWTVDNEIDEMRVHPDDRVYRDIDREVIGGADLDARDRHQAEALERGLPIPDIQRRYLEVPEGTAVLAHYDLFHRGSRAVGADRPRFMYKFNAVRVSEPAPTGRSILIDSDLARLTPSLRPELAPVVEANLAWLQGVDPVAVDPADPDEIVVLTEDLLTGRQDRQLAAAYRLARLACSSQDALTALEHGLHGSNESTRRAASHGLRNAGRSGTEILLEALASPRAVVRRRAVAGMSAGAHRVPGVVTALVAALVSDSDELVRSNAAYNLGHVARTVDDAGDVASIVDGLLDRLAPGAEPDNVFGAEFSRSTVRQSAGYALGLVVANHRLADEQLDAVIDGPLQDHDRYVEGMVAEGLARAEHLSPAARRRMTSYLVSRRWNRTPQHPMQRSLPPAHDDPPGQPAGAT